MEFFKTTFWASLSTGVTMLCGLITTKYLAVLIGPAGMAYVGQFTNVMVLILLLATGACVSGVVKYISQHKDIETQRSIFSNALILSSIAVFITGLVIIVFSGILSDNIFHTKSFQDILIIYGLAMVFPTFNMLASAVFNGLHQIRTMSLLNIFNSAVNVAAVIISAKYFGIKGVLLASLVSAFLSFFIYLYFLNKKDILPQQAWFKNYHPQSMKLLLGFTAMNIVSGIIAPSLQLFVRTKLLHNFDANTAGLWQANIRLSDFYLNFVYTVITIYYLPRLSEIQDHKLLKREIRLAYVRILPIVIAITFGIWIFRDLIVRVFLTQNFIDMLVLLKWQLIGDVIKIASWILGYILVAKAMKKLFIGTELIFSLLFVLLNYYFINTYGMVGTVYAFALNYFLYLVTLAVILRKYIF